MVADIEMKRIPRCGYQEFELGSCNRHPWHGLLYVIDKNSQREEFISSVALVDLKNQSPKLITIGAIVNQGRLNHQYLEQLVVKIQLLTSNSKYF